MSTAPVITHQPLRYFGSKWRLAPWILAHFPPHVCYVELFGGGASILFRKPPAELEVYNDIDGAVVTFFRVLRERPADLIRAIELTPYARAEHALAHEPIDDGDELEIARRLYVRAWQAFGGPRSRTRSSWRTMKDNARGVTVIDDWCRTAHLDATAARLKQVQIECDDFEAVIRRFDTPATLFYADPPYAGLSRETQASYTHRMTDDDHRRLARALDGIAGMAVVSGAPGPLYDGLYTDWTRIERRDRSLVNTPTTEVLWLSPAVAARERQLAMQLEED